jgi:DNA transformation protein
MFGGAGIYRDGVMFALVAGEDVYLKADDATRARFREAGCRCFVYEKDGKTVEMSYWSIPDEAMDDPELLKSWADLAWTAALRSKKPRRRKPSVRQA